MKNKSGQFKKRREEVRESVVKYEDENAIWYTLLGLVIWLVVVSCSVMTCELFGLFDCKEKDDGIIERFTPEPIPVIIPDPDIYNEEEFEELIEKNPLRSNISTYKVI